MRTRALVALIVASLSLFVPGLASATVAADKDDAASAKDRDDKSKADDDAPAPPPTEAPKPLEKPAPGLAYAYATYRVFATQFEPTVPASVEVAVPDKCVKFAGLRNTNALAALKCPASYSLDRDYRMVVTRDGGEPGIVPVKEAGPWNIDDNWWSGRRADEPRRLYADLPAGRPEAQVASSSGYNMVEDCKDLAGKLTGTRGGADQFGRCVRNPAGIDLSVAAARALGFGPLENAWVNVTLLWEPVEVVVTNVKSGKALDVKDGSRLDIAPVIQHSYVGGANQHWRLRPLSGDVYTISVGHTGKLLDVRDGSTAEGAPVMQHAAAGGANQQWRLVPRTFTPAGAGRPASGVVTLVSVGSGKVLDVAGGSTAEAAAVVQSAPTGVANQNWRLTIIEPPVPAKPAGAANDTAKPATDTAKAAPAPATSPAPTGGPPPAAPAPAAAPASGPSPIATPRELPAG